MYADRIGAHRERESGIDFLTGRDLTLPKKVFIDKATVFPIVRYRYESWTVKKAEH